VAVADARGLIESRNLVAVHGLSPSGFADRGRGASQHADRASRFDRLLVASRWAEPSVAPGRCRGVDQRRRHFPTTLILGSVRR
jgi:hypothetical protein